MSEDEEEGIPRRLKRFKRKEEDEEKEAVQTEEKPAAAETPSVPAEAAGEKKAEGASEAEAEEEGLSSAVNAMEREEEAEALVGEKEGGRAKVDVLARHELRRFREQFNRFPDSQELETIADNIFEQLKKEQKKLKVEEVSSRVKQQSRQEKERQQRFEGRKQAREARLKGLKGEQEQALAPEQKPQEQPAVELSVSDILGQGSAQQKKKSMEDEFSLGGLEEGIDKGALSGLPAGEEMPELKELGTEKNACPSCGKQAPNILFCPGCGNAFCENCAKSKTAEKDFLRVVCPKCQKEFKTKA